LTRDTLVEKVRTLLRKSACSFWEAGKETENALERGEIESIRKFALKVGCSHTTLDYAVAVFRNHPSLESITPNSTVRGLIEEVKKSRKLANGLPETTTRTPSLTYGPRMRQLISALHYYVRRDEREKAQLVVEELMNGDKTCQTTTINELELMLDEETSDMLLIFAADVLIRRIRNEEGRIAVNNGIAVRCAMIVAGWLADTPKDRTVDDHFVVQRILSQLGEHFSKSAESAASLLNRRFVPLELPSMEEMHRSLKSGVEGDLAMARNGSITTTKTERYAKQRLEMEELLTKKIAESE
jgi:hypothetical protein